MSTSNASRQRRVPLTAASASPPPPPQPPAQPTIIVRYAPLYWRRWAFASFAVFYLLFAVVRLHTARITYAPVMSNPPMPPLIARLLLSVLFWGAMSAAVCADLAIALGLYRRHYHRLLGISLGCSASIAIFLGGIELIYSTIVGYGFSEPLTWLTLGASQVFVALSAFKAPAPKTLDLVQLSLVWAERLRRAGVAFVNALLEADELPEAHDDETAETTAETKV